jgi:2-keto-4-pentenoate hydratase/2-oxohepta-3-ene-1,7-dioic acid hydratase in catechol pathway
MRIARFVADGESTPRAGEVQGDEVVAFAEADAVERVLAGGERAPATGETHRLADVSLLAPLTPRAIFGIGLNYADHAAETGRDAPEFPIVFMKLPSSSAAPNEPLEIPQVIHRLDYEGELAVIMGRGGEVAGYAVADDVSARDLQGREPQWTRAKGFDNSCPWGPWITTADEVGDPHALSLRTWVNGELRQDGSTANLIFTVPEIVAFLSETCTLEPGDLILTGTPAGVGMAMDPMRFLASGDVVRIEIESLGAIEHAIA